MTSRVDVRDVRDVRDDRDDRNDQEQVSTSRLPPGGLRVLLMSLPLVVLGLLVFYPLCFTVYEAFMGSSRLYYQANGFGAVFAEVLASAQFQSALSNTIIIAVLSTAGCLVLGFVLALIVSFVPFPGSHVLGRFIDAYLAFPSFLIALSFTFLYGSNGLVNGALMHLLGASTPPLGNFVNTRWAVILAEVTFYTPFVMRPLLAAFSQLDGGLIDVASSLGARPMRIIRQIILPDAIPALLAGGSLTLILTLNEFGIVAMIGAKDVTTLTLQIYSEAIVNNDNTIASAMAVVSIVVSLALYWLYRTILRRSGGNHAGAL
jgi:2-aminoethylphosphonate transport system permease protein